MLQHRLDRDRPGKNGKQNVNQIKLTSKYKKIEGVD